MPSIPCLAWSCLISALPVVGSAQVATTFGVIDGIVTDTNLVAIGGATISILGSDVRVSTGDNGRFRITGLRAAHYILAVHHIGFIPAAMAIGVETSDTLRPSFALLRVTTALDTMIVTAKSAVSRLNEFEERRAHNVGGHFITGDEMEKRGSVFLADVIRVVPAVDIKTPPGHGLVQIAVDTRGGSKCPYQIFLDGLPMPTPTNLANLPPPEDLAGVEIYAGPASTPLMYKFDASNCGVILLWTKRGQ